MELSKTWIFNLYFNCRDEEQRVWAEAKREATLTYMRGTMERMSRFSVIAKDRKDSVLLLRGYMHLKNQVTRDYVKKILGKYSNCKRAGTSDVVNLLKYFNIDKEVAVTGELPSSLNKGKRDDARWILKMANDKGDDFRLKSETESVVEVNSIGGG
jgi:hypothetical protein